MPRQFGLLRVGAVTLVILLPIALGCSKRPTADPAAAPSTASTPPVEVQADSSKATTDPERLNVGAVAPKLELAHWVQGEQIDGFQPGHVYVVEFWATWCGPCRDGMPHIAELQQRYQDKVTFIGVTGENEATVTHFLGKTQNAETGETWGDVVTYALALDSDRATSTAYMQAAGRNGIPCAFVVGPDGHIEWIGHPAAIDEPLEQIVAGTWDRSEYLVRYRKQQEKELAMRRAIMLLQQAQQEGDWDKALSALDEFIEQSPEQPGMKLVKLSLLLRARHFEDAETLAEQIADENWENPDQLNAIAWSLATQYQDSSQRLQLALRLAKRASELHQQQDAATLDTLARVYYELGNLDEAIAWQEKAVALNAGIEGIETTLEKYLFERDGAVGSAAAEESENDLNNRTDQLLETDAAAEAAIDPSN